jgi:opacity protein-like surface antigen
MKKLARSFAVFVFVIAVSVFPCNTASAQIGWYVGVFGGYTFGPDASLWYNDYNYNYYYDYKYDVNVQETWAFGFKVGFAPPVLRFFSFEFEYSFLNPDIDRTVLPRSGTYYATVDGDVKFNNFMFNAIAKYPEGRFHPYVGVGFGVSSVDISLSSTSPTGYVSSVSNDDTFFAWQVLLGVEIDLTKNLSMDIGYRYFAVEADHDNDNYYYYNYYSTQIDYNTNMVTFGLKYKF